MGELLEEKVTLDVEGIDRLYLNLYQPMLQTGGGVASFFKQHRGAKVASTALMGPMSHAFVKSIRDYQDLFVRHWAPGLNERLLGSCTHPGSSGQ